MSSNLWLYSPARCDGDFCPKDCNNCEKAAEHDDLISRAAAIGALDVLCQEHRYKIPGKRETYSQYNEAWQDALDRAEGAIFNLPSAQPTAEDCERPCTADDYWHCNDCDHMEVCRYYPMKVCEYKSQPPAQPEPKRGRWIEFDSDEDKYDVIKCSCCKHIFTVDSYHWTDIGFVKDDFRFCPNCGAKMETQP